MEQARLRNVANTVTITNTVEQIPRQVATNPPTPVVAMAHPGEFAATPYPVATPMPAQAISQPMAQAVPQPVPQVATQPMAQAVPQPVPQVAAQPMAQAQAVARPVGLPVAVAAAVPMADGVQTTTYAL